MDASEENDGYSSAEDPMNSDPEEDGGKKLVSHCSCNYPEFLVPFLLSFNHNNNLLVCLCV